MMDNGLSEIANDVDNFLDIYNPRLRDLGLQMQCGCSLKTGSLDVKLLTLESQAPDSEALERVKEILPHNYKGQNRMYNVTVSVGEVFDPQSPQS